MTHRWISRLLLITIFLCTGLVQAPAAAAKGPADPYDFNGDGYADLAIGVPGDRATLELMMTRPPAVVVRSRYRAGQMSSATAWLRHPAANRVRAARTLDTDGRRWATIEAVSAARWSGEW